jgi:hypothetical protein
MPSFLKYLLRSPIFVERLQILASQPCLATPRCSEHVSIAFIVVSLVFFQPPHKKKEKGISFCF